MSTEERKVLIEAIIEMPYNHAALRLLKQKMFRQTAPLFLTL